MRDFEFQHIQVQTAIFMKLGFYSTHAYFDKVERGVSLNQFIEKKDYILIHFSYCNLQTSLDLDYQFIIMQFYILYLFICI